MSENINFDHNSWQNSWLKSFVKNFVKNIVKHILILYEFSVKSSSCILNSCMHCTTAMLLEAASCLMGAAHASPAPPILLSACLFGKKIVPNTP